MDTDVALLHTEHPNNEWLKLNPIPIHVGDLVFTPSNPRTARFLFTDGIVSGEERFQLTSSPGEMYVVATPPVFEGSSGCALLDRNMSVIGLASAILYNQPVYGLYVPVRELQNLLTGRK